MSGDSRYTDRSDRDPSWSNLTKEYDPIRVGSIDGTDTIPHDKGIVRALNSKYKTNRNIKGKPHHTLFVGHLDFRTTEENLREKFSKYGNVVSCHLIRDIVTGMSKGYAFVEYDSSKSTRNAYKYMNSDYVDGTKILVDYELERSLPGWKPRRLGGGFGGKKESGQLRFGCRARPFQKPIVLNRNFNKFNTNRDFEGR